MHKVNILVKFILVCMIFMAGQCYCLTVEEFMTKNSIDGTEPFFKEDKFMITADDGVSLVLRALNPYYDSNLRPPIPKPFFSIRDNNVYPNIFGESFYFLLCENETHILLMFDSDKNYPQKQKDKLTLVKYGDFTPASVYIFSYLYPQNDMIAEKKVWIDIENDKFCGTYMYPYIYFDIDNIPTDDGRDYYNFMKYFYISEIEKEIQRCNDIFTNNVDYKINREIFYGYSAFKIYDKEMENRFASQLAELNKNKWKFGREYKNDMVWVESSVMSVSNIQDLYYRVLNNKDFAKTRPDIIGELPTTDEELEKYLSWQTSNYVGDPVLKDRYHTPLKFEIIPEGLKATSAGKDKIWDTEDDRYFIRTYRSVGMNPLN